MAEKRGSNKETDITGDFKAVYFTNAQYGWAVGDEGLIATTDDGGRHWTLQRSGTYAMLRDVFFANSKEGWIVGEDADVLYTENGGKQWNRYEYVSEFPLNGIWFVNDSRGWVVGEYDRIFYTETAGKSWREQSNRFDGERDRLINDNKKIFFISDNEGWIAGSDGSIFHTTTGGTTWENGKTAEYHSSTDMSEIPSTASTSPMRITASALRMSGLSRAPKMAAIIGS